MTSHEKLIALAEAIANDDKEKFSEICNEATTNDVRYWAQFAKITLNFAINAYPIKELMEAENDPFHWN